MRDWTFTDNDLEYLSRGTDQSAALASELLFFRKLTEAANDLRSLYPHRINFDSCS
jgi:hypothetical protein